VVFYWAACVDKYKLKEVTDFVELDCFTISIIGDCAPLRWKTPKMKV